MRSQIECLRMILKREYSEVVLRGLVVTALAAFKLKTDLATSFIFLLFSQSIQVIILIENRPSNFAFILLSRNVHGHMSKLSLRSLFR